MANEFLQNVNLELLSQELGKDINGLSELLDVSTQTIYKWNRTKVKGGCRPTYDTIYQMLKSGASLKSIFGIEGEILKAKEIDQKDFLEGVRQALAQLAESSHK